MIGRRARRALGESGFTLIELMIGVTVLSIIVGVIGFVMTTSLRNEDATQKTIRDSADLSLLSLRFPRDIASVDATDTAVDVTPAAPPMCSNVAAGGASVVRLAATDPVTGAKDYTSYRTEPATSPFAQLARYECLVDKNNNQVKSTSRNVMARYLTSSTSATAARTPATGPATLVTLTVTDESGTPVTISGTPRANAAPGNGSGGPCTYLTGTVTPSTVSLVGSTLRQPVTIAVYTTGGCSGLGLSFDTGTGTRTVALAGAGNNWTYTIATTLATWAAGNRTITVTGATNSGSLALNVQNACGYVSGSAVPSSVKMNGGALVQQITVTVNTTGVCAAALQLQFNPGSGTRTVSMTQVTPTQYTYTTTAGITWTAGTKSFSVLGTVTTPTPVVAASVTQSCAYASGGVSPAPAIINGAGRLQSAETITVTTTGPCSGYHVGVNYAPGATSASLALTPNASATTWTGTMPATGAGSYVWTAGTKSFTVTGVDAPANPSFNLSVQQACSYVSGSASPSAGKLNAGALTQQITFTVNTSLACPAPPQLQFNPGSGTRTVTMSQSSPTQYTYTTTNAYTWTTGTKSINVLGTLTSPTPTMSVTLTNACVFSSGSVSPATMVVDGGGRLQSAVTIGVTTTGSCNAATLRVDFSPSGGATQSIALTANASYTTWTATIPATGTGSYTWTAGTKTFTVVGVDAPASATFTGSVVLACSVASSSVGPYGYVVRSGDATSGGLTADLTFAVVTNGNCTNVSLTVDTGTATPTIALASGGANTWTGTLLRGTYLWTTGAHNFTINATGTPNATGTIPFSVTTAPCAVASSSDSPSTAYRMSAATGLRRLASSVSLTVTTTGTCATVATAIGTGGASAPTVTLAESSPGSGVWQGSLPWNAANDWSAGSKAFLISLNGAQAPQTIPLSVQDASCAVVSAAVALDPTTRSSTTRLLTSATVLTVTTTGTCTLTANIYTGRTTQNGVALAQSNLNTWTLDLRALGLQWNSGTFTQTVLNNATTIRSVVHRVN